MEKAINPMKDSPLEFIWLSRPRPFHVNVGMLVDVELKDKTIIAHCRISDGQLEESEFFDRKNDRIFVQLLDGNKVPVTGNWVPASKCASFKLCLRER